MFSAPDRDTYKLIIGLTLISAAAAIFAGVGAALEGDFPTKARIGVPIIMGLALILCAVYLYKAIRGLSRTADRDTQD